MATANSTQQKSPNEVIGGISPKRVGDASLKIECAKSLVSAFGIFVKDALDREGELPISGLLFEKATIGICMLLESAESDLQALE